MQRDQLATLLTSGCHLIPAGMWATVPTQALIQVFKHQCAKAEGELNKERTTAPHAPLSCHPQHSYGGRMLHPAGTPALPHSAPPSKAPSEMAKNQGPGIWHRLCYKQERGKKSLCCYCFSHHLKMFLGTEQEQIGK